jgi:hypothetical protein
MIDTSTPLYCANHPSVETSLRCNNCEKPICPKCAVLTPTGYRCKECVRGQQKVFDTSQPIDYPIAFVIAGVLAFAGSFLAAIIGFFVIFLAPFAGMIIAEIVRRAVGRRRSPTLFLTAAIGALVGCLPLLLRSIIFMLLGTPMYGLMGLIWQAVYAFTIVSTVYYRLRGIRMR